LLPFTKVKVIFVVYVDKCLLCDYNLDVIHFFVAERQAARFDVITERDIILLIFESFSQEKSNNRTVELTQAGLIKRGIIQLTRSSSH
jgi:hypothetical protein